MKPAKQVNLDEALLERYVRQLQYGVNIRYIEIKSAAVAMARYVWPWLFLKAWHHK
jgi:hypothetical protein